MADIYSTNDTAKLIGISPNTLRTWKNRTFQERLIENTHWVNQQNQIFWTDAGVAELRAIAESTPESASESGVDSTLNPVPIQQQSATDSIKTMLQPLASGIAAQALPLLRELVIEELRGGIPSTFAKPITSQECVTLLMDLGIKPCDPAALIGGNFPTLPESNQ